MTTIVVDEVHLEPRRGSGWGWSLGVGIAWIVIALSLFSFNPTTISLISYLVAAVLLLAGAAELAMGVAIPAWRWLHLAGGAAFVVLGVLALLEPLRTFAGLAVLFGWYLVLKGTLLLVLALSTRVPGSLWGLGVGIGLTNVVIGLWALGYPGRSAWLLVLWVGTGALLHGISDIVRAFELRAR